MVDWTDRNGAGAQKRAEVADTIRQIDSVVWPQLPKMPRGWEWPEVKGSLTDYQPRQGKKLQRWKRADTCAELLGFLSSSVSELSDLMQVKADEATENEDLSLKEQLAIVGPLETFIEEGYDIHDKVDEAAAQIRKIQFPAMR